MAVMATAGIIAGIIVAACAVIGCAVSAVAFFWRYAQAKAREKDRQDRIAADLHELRLKLNPGPVENPPLEREPDGRG
jgi:hypothetical protein